MLVEVAGQEHCAYKPCGQLDFLPFTCPSCKKKFCHEHAAEKEHGCDKLARIKVDEIGLRDGAHKKERCSLQSCQTVLNETNAFLCKSCKRLFCTRHRLFESHDCEAQKQANQVRQKQPKEIDDKPQKGKPSKAKSSFWCSCFTSKPKKPAKKSEARGTAGTKK